MKQWHSQTDSIVFDFFVLISRVSFTSDQTTHILRWLGRTVPGASLFC